MTTFYADRATILFAAGEDADSFVTNEVTIEDRSGEPDRLADFETIAWCPNQEAADKVARALRVLEFLEEWSEGDEEDRDALTAVQDALSL